MDRKSFYFGLTCICIPSDNCKMSIEFSWIKEIWFINGTADFRLLFEDFYIYPAVVQPRVSQQCWDRKCQSIKHMNEFIYTLSLTELAQIKVTYYWVVQFLFSMLYWWLMFHWREICLFCVCIWRTDRQKCDSNTVHCITCSHTVKIRRRWRCDSKLVINPVISVKN